MGIVNVKRVYEDGLIFYIRSNGNTEHIVYVFEGDKHLNTFKVKKIESGKRMYEDLLKKVCDVGYTDYVQTSEIDEEIVKMFEKEGNK